MNHQNSRRDLVYVIPGIFVAIVSDHFIGFIGAATTVLERSLRAAIVAGVGVCLGYGARVAIRALNRDFPDSGSH